MTVETIPTRTVLLTPQEVADMLRIPKRTLYVQRSAGRETPPGVKVGRHLRYRLADVEAWIASLPASQDGGAA